MATLPSATDDMIADAFMPYFLAVGKVAYEWNRLQEALAKLFCVATGIDQSMGLPIWHVLKSDRLQRDILTAAINADFRWRKKYPTAHDDLTWLLSATNTLAEQRNDAIHAPCTLHIEFDPPELQIVPDSFYQNRLAKKLVGKDIFKEFEWYRAKAKTLRLFAEAAYPALYFRKRPWPDRPLLPSLGQAPPRTE